MKEKMKSVLRIAAFVLLWVTIVFLLTLAIIISDRPLVA